KRVVHLGLRQQPGLTEPQGDSPCDAVTHRDEAGGDDPARARDPDGLPCSLPLLSSVTAKGPVGQLLLHSRRHYEPGVTQALSNNEERINDVFDAVGQIEKDIGVNADELWPVWSRRHSKASGIPR